MRHPPHCVYIVFVAELLNLGLLLALEKLWIYDR